MKKVLFILLAGLILTGLSAEMVDRIVGKVGADIILMSDVYKQMQQMQSAGVPKESITPGIVLQQIVEQKVIYQKAKDLDIKIDDEKITKYAERYLGQIKEKYPSEAAFTADLAREKLTERDLLDYYKGLLTESAMSDQLVERYVTSQIAVTEKEMLDFYEVSKDSLAIKPLTWQTGLILYNIQPSKESEAAKLAEMQDIQRRLNQGEDFATLAREVSDCPSAERGGDLGFFSKGMMVKPFEDAAFALNEGEVSEIVRTEFGYHIIKMDKKRSTEVSASHILKLLTPTAADTLAAHQTMEMVREQFSTGKQTFSDLARKYSAEPEAQTTGGIIGDLAADEMPELFAVQILATPVGQMTPVLENEGILYLFARLSETPMRLYTYEEAKPKLQEYLFTEKQAKAYNEWILKLISESYVQIVE